VGALAAGAALVPAALCSVLAGRGVGAAARHFSPWTTATVLAAAAAVGVAVAAVAVSVPGVVLGVVLALALTTVGFAGSQTVLVGLVPHLVPSQHRAAAQGLFSFLLYGGSSIGPAAVGGLSSALPLPVALLLVAVLPVVAVVVGLGHRQVPTTPERPATPGGVDDTGG